MENETGTRFPTLFAQLMMPFGPDQVKERPGSRGATLHYIDATTAENRLDDVLGPENWGFEAKPWGDSALIGTLKMTMPDGTVVSKSSVGAKAGMDEGDDDAKSADSDAFKRCCFRFGIGRYLRKSGLPTFVMTELNMSAQDLAVMSGGTRSSPPPPGRPAPSNSPAPPQGNGQGRQFSDTECPQSGKGLFAWAKTRQDKGVEGVIDFINEHGKKRGWSNRMIEWNQGQVREAWDACHGTP